MSDLANVNAPPDLRPDGPQEYPYRVRAHLMPRPIAAQGGQPHHSRHLTRPEGVADRPQSMDVGFWSRPWQWWQRLTGAHGVVGEPTEIPAITGGQHAWPNYNRRTFRQSPVVPWDQAAEIEGGPV